MKQQTQRYKSITVSPVMSSWAHQRPILPQHTGPSNLPWWPVRSLLMAEEEEEDEAQDYEAVEHRAHHRQRDVAAPQLQASRATMPHIDSGVRREGPPPMCHT